MSRPIISSGRSADAYLRGGGGRGNERLKLLGMALGAVAALLLAGAIGYVLGRNSVDTTAGETAATTTTVDVTTTVAPTTTTEVRPETYVVKKGDNLAKIAQQFGTTVAALVELNGIQNPNRLFEGLTLKIPPPTTPTTEQPATTVAPTTTAG